MHGRSRTTIEQLGKEGWGAAVLRLVRHKTRTPHDWTRATIAEILVGRPDYFLSEEGP